MNALGRYASLPLLAALVAVAAYRRVAPPAAEPVPSPMIVALPVDEPQDHEEAPAARVEEPASAGFLKMARAGLSDETIAAHARSVGFRPTVDDLIELKRQGAGDALLGRLAGAAPPPSQEPAPVPIAPPVAAPVIEGAAPAPPVPTPIIVTNVFPVTEIVVQAPPPKPEVVEASIVQIVVICPVHRHAACPCVKQPQPRPNDSSFKTIPFLRNPPMPSASISKAGPTWDGKTRGR